MKFKKRIMLSFLFCFLTLFFVSCMNASKEEVINQIKAGNYQQVLEDIHGLSTTERAQVQAVAVDKIPIVVQSVKDKKITPSQGVDELNFIKRIVPKSEEGKINTAIEEVKALDSITNVT
ncbi:MAG: hypothetical protein ACRCWM_00425 [Sarcina sp.]